MSSSLIHRTCPVCDAQQADHYLQKGELRLVRCRRCSMVYANPVSEQMASGQYYDERGLDYYLSPAKLESDYAPVRFERELRLFRKYCRMGTVLDVGCSSGAFLFQLRQRFPDQYEVLGTDVSGAPLDYAESKGVPVIRGSFPEQEFGAKQFDAVTFWAVLEHLLDPKRFLEKAARILKPNGYCFVLVPNLQSLAVRWLGNRYRYIYPQHLNYFTADTLRQFVASHFSVAELRTTHFNPIVLWQDWLGKGGDVSNQQRAALLKKTTAYKQNPLLRPAKAIYHSVEVTLGRFKLADNLAVALRKA